MQNERNEKAEQSGAAMRKRRETMPDGRRYIIYYVFENNGDAARNDEPNENENNLPGSMPGIPNP